jgi:tRNA (guanine-N7-)-methyltransferase
VTAPRSLPPPFWSLLFGNDDPVEIEIGAGDGTFLALAARQRPAHNFLGIEHAPARARRLAERIARLRTARIRMLRADAACVVTTIIPPASVTAYHVYFPDPWPKQRHAKRRLFRPPVIAALARTLMPGGRLLVATDVFGYGRLIRARVLDDGGFAEVPVDAQHGGLVTTFARKYQTRGRALYTAAFVRVARHDRGGDRA